MKPICLAVLDTMWTGTYEQAPKLFTINRYNTSGRRLYSLTTGWQLITTNSCQYTAKSATEHGRPSPEWLGSNICEAILRFGTVNLLLVCGEVAKQTYAQVPAIEGVQYVMEIPHPAARMWSREMLEKTQQEIHMVLLRQSVRRKS